MRTREKGVGKKRERGESMNNRSTRQKKNRKNKYNLEYFALNKPIVRGIELM